MKNSIFKSAILLLFFVITTSLAKANLPLFQQKSFSMTTAEKLFTQKKWEDALKAYQAILPGLQGEELDRANDRLGDIYFFLGHYDTSKIFHTKAKEAVLKRAGNSLTNAMKLFLGENYRAAEGPTYDLDKQTKLSQLINFKLIFAEALLSCDEAVTQNLAEELKLKSNEFITIYHRVLMDNGFKLDAYSYNSLTDKMNEKKSEITSIIGEINKISGRDSTKVK